MNWIQRNFKTIIYFAFLVPILTVAFVSISHVTTWYGLSNPISWAIYLSFGIEIAALAALAAISAKMGGKVYVPFGIVTLIQFIGNIFFAYQYIDINSDQFKDWVELTDPVVSYLGVESGNLVGHKRFLSLFSGGLLPIISLSFLHMLVKYEEEDKLVKNDTPPNTDNTNIVAPNLAPIQPEVFSDTKEVEHRYIPTENDLLKLEEYLNEINKKKFGENKPEVDNLSATENVGEPVESKSESIDVVEINELPETSPVSESNDIMEINELPETLPVSESNDIVEINESPEVLSIPESEPEFNVIFKDVTTDNTANSETNNEESTFTVEPDFYVEDKPDYHIDEPVQTNVKNNVRRLNYFRPH